MMVELDELAWKVGFVDSPFSDMLHIAEPCFRVNVYGGSIESLLYCLACFLTSNNSPTNSNDTFDLVDTLVGPTHGQSLGQTTKTLATLDVFRNFCRVLQNSPKHSKIYFMKVVHLDDGHKFHVDSHFKF
jgi:hypothetical protein